MPAMRRMTCAAIALALCAAGAPAAVDGFSGSKVGGGAPTPTPPPTDYVAPPSAPSPVPLPSGGSEASPGYSGLTPDASGVDPGYVGPNVVLVFKTLPPPDVTDPKLDAGEPVTLPSDFNVTKDAEEREQQCYADLKPRVWDSRVDYLLSQYYHGIPHSYNAPDSYFRSRAYMELHANPLDGQQSIEDRVSTKFGLNLYDAATWEIALGLQNHFEIPAVYNKEVLYGSTTGRAAPLPGGLKNIRANSQDYKYGQSGTPGDSIEKVTMPGGYANPTSQDNTNKKIEGSFFFRMISDCYLCEDPLIGPYAKSFQYKHDPNFKGTEPLNAPRWNMNGAIIWNDWKPITGEQAWGVMIGPLQNLYLKYQGEVPFWTTFEEMPAEVQLGLSIMPAVVLMQSTPGSMYHCPIGTQIFPIDEHEGENVSNENNLSMYAGLRILQYFLVNNTIANNGVYDPYIKTQMDQLQGVCDNLVKWFSTPGAMFTVEALEFPGLAPSKIGYQGGHVSFANGGYAPVEIMKPSGFAVDCQTWCMSVMLPYLPDIVAKTLGEDGPYNLWQQVKARGGYYNSTGHIAGVGFTQVFDDSCIAEAVGGGDSISMATEAQNNSCTTHEIWSAEWSFGAALMTKIMAKTYKTTNPTRYAELMAEAKSITDNVMKLQSDGGLFNNETSGEHSDGGLLYGNKRFFIPWGWYANPVSSLCGTAWSIMNEHDFNPFVLGGGDALVPVPKLSHFAGHSR